MGKFNFNLENKKFLIQQSLVESPDGACCSAIIWLYAESKFAFYAIDCIKGQMLISVYLALDNLGTSLNYTVETYLQKNHFS